MKAIILVIALALAGCGGIEAEKPRASIKVDMPIPTSCIKETPKHPDFVTDIKLNAMSAYQFVTALFVDRLQRDGYEAQLEAALDACK